MLTNIDIDGALVSRPMSPLDMDGKGALWFFTNRRPTKVENLHALNVSFSDEANATYVSLTGHGELLADHAHIERLCTPFAKTWFPERSAYASLSLLKFVLDSDGYWDAPHSKMVRMFAMAASVVTGVAAEMGEHTTLTKLSKPLPATTPV